MHTSNPTPDLPGMEYRNMFSSPSRGADAWTTALGHAHPCAAGHMHTSKAALVVTKYKQPDAH
jgi:hypothetical protein